MLLMLQSSSWDWKILLMKLCVWHKCRNLNLINSPFDFSQVTFNGETPTIFLLSKTEGSATYRFADGNEQSAKSFYNLLQPDSCARQIVPFIVFSSQATKGLAKEENARWMLTWEPPRFHHVLLLTLFIHGVWWLNWVAVSLLYSTASIIIPPHIFRSNFSVARCQARRCNHISDNYVEEQWIEFCLHFAFLSCRVSSCWPFQSHIQWCRLRGINKRCSSTFHRRAEDEHRKRFPSKNESFFN